MRKTYLFKVLIGFALLMFGLVPMSKAQTTFLTVGCGGGHPNYPSLRAAFQWVETSYFPGNVDISICSGTYFENAYINSTATTGPGHRVIVHSATYNPADVTLKPISVGQSQVLRINGVNDVFFEGISFENPVAPLFGTAHVIRLQAGAGDVSFINCEMLGTTPGSGSYVKESFSVVEVADLQQSLSFTQCTLRDGGMGIHIKSADPSGILFFQNSSILLAKGDGIKEDVPLLVTLVENSNINCFGTGDWNGITTQYGDGTFLFVINTNITTFGAGKCQGILAQAEFVELRDNNIRMAEHQKAYGVSLSAQSLEVQVDRNTIDYPGMMYTSVRPDSFMGVFRQSPIPFSAAKGGFNVNENQILCNGADEAIGIYAHFKADFGTGIFVNDNLVSLDDIGEAGTDSAGKRNGFWLMGIKLEASAGLVDQFEVSRNNILLNPIAGYLSSGIFLEGFRHQQDARIFHNVIDIVDSEVDFSKGLEVVRFLSWNNSRTYVGNNAVSLESTENKGSRAFFVWIANGLSDLVLWHNSVHLHGSQAPDHSEALYVWGQTSGGTLKLTNNVFANSTGGLAINNDIYVNNWTVSNSNCYYALPGTDLGRWGSSPLADLAAVQAVTLDDLQSVALDPQFYAPNNLHLGSMSPLRGINGIILPFGGTTFSLNWDIDGDARFATNNREIGCDEVGMPELPEQLKSDFVQTEKASLYPNPCHGQAHLDWTGHGPATVQLCDLQGRVLRVWSMDGSGIDLDLSGVPAGVYLLLAQEGASRIRKKIIIQ